MKHARTTVVCPSCSMEASVVDGRLLQPVDGQRPGVRRCRNCQALIDVSAPTPRIETSLA